MPTLNLHFSKLNPTYTYLLKFFGYELQSILWIGLLRWTWGEIVSGVFVGPYQGPFTWDPCPFVLPEILTVAHVVNSKDPRQGGPPPAAACRGAGVGHTAARSFRGCTCERGSKLPKGGIPDPQKRDTRLYARNFQHGSCGTGFMTVW